MAIDTNIPIRSAAPADELALWLMLMYAASMDGGGPAQILQAKSDPYLRLYVDNWEEREGDLGVVAIDDNARAVGAA